MPPKKRKQAKKEAKNQKLKEEKIKTKKVLEKSKNKFTLGVKLMFDRFKSLKLNKGQNISVKFACDCGKERKQASSLKANRTVTVCSEQVNLVLKCKYCKRDSMTVTLHEKSAKVNKADCVQQKTVELLTLYCTGVKPVEYIPDHTWTAVWDNEERTTITNYVLNNVVVVDGEETRASLVAHTFY